MLRVSSLVSSKIGDTLTNIKTWGPLVYNVLENGLVGDGVTDDTAELQGLINTAISEGRRTIAFPHTSTGGEYFVTSLTNADQVDFIGDNCRFVGGYVGSISNIGGVATLEYDTNNINSKFINRLADGAVIRIKLIGDSITDGNGARNYSPPPDSNPIIFNDGHGTVFHEPSYGNTCWANMFREYINNNFSDVEFINAGIGGKSAKWGNSNKQYWISDSEDVVLVMLGTNDRWDCLDPEEFESNLIELLSYTDDRSNVMIVMTATPTQNDSDTITYNFGMKEVDRVITDVCQRSGYIHISHYRELLQFSQQSGATLKTLIEDGGSHPVDEGYTAMWKTVQQRLGFIDSTTNWNNSNPSSLYTVLIGAQYPYVMSTTSISFFDVGKKTVVELEAYSDIENFPEETTGWLTTVRGFTNDLYSHQIWEPRESYNIYKRTWNFGSSSWNSWIMLNASATVPAARVYNNADQSIPNSALTAVAFNSERFDTDGIHDPTTNNSRLTCKTAGKYQITGQVTFANNTTGLRSINIRHNGSTVVAFSEASADNSGADRLQVTTLYDLAVNDYVELIAFQASGSPLNVRFSAQSSPEFMMVKVG